MVGRRLRVSRPPQHHYCRDVCVFLIHRESTTTPPWFHIPSNFKVLRHSPCAQMPRHSIRGHPRHRAFIPYGVSVDFVYTAAHPRPSNPQLHRLDFILDPPRSWQSHRFMLLFRDRRRTTYIVLFCYALNWSSSTMAKFLILHL